VRCCQTSAVPTGSGGALYALRRLLDRGKLIVVEGEPRPPVVPAHDGTDHLALVPHRVGVPLRRTRQSMNDPGNCPASRLASCTWISRSRIICPDATSPSRPCPPGEPRSPEPEYPYPGSTGAARFPRRLRSGGRGEEIFVYADLELNQVEASIQLLSVRVDALLVPAPQVQPLRLVALACPDQFRVAAVVAPRPGPRP